VNATTTIAPRPEGARTAAMSPATGSRVHITTHYGAALTRCAVVIGDTWYRMTDWTPTPGGSALCRSCLRAERKVNEAAAHLARIKEEDRQRAERAAAAAHPGEDLGSVVEATVAAAGGTTPAQAARIATARRITATVKAATNGLAWTTTSQGPYSFRVVLGAIYGNDSVDGAFAATAVRGMEGMTVTWGRDRRTGKIVLNVTDETAREASIKEQADLRDATMARELGYSSVEAYRGAPGRGPSPEVVASAVAQFQKELTAAAPAIGRIMDEPLPGEAAPEELAAWRLSATERQRAEGERNARLMAHRTAMREADRAPGGWREATVELAALTPATVTLTNPELWA
jgi:hypothetical protein